MDGGECEDELLRHIRDIAESRTLVLATVIIDSILLSGVVSMAIGLHYLIGPINQYSFIDQFAIRGLQVIDAAGTVGPMLGYLLMDLIEIFRRIRAR